jgi:hypothetical protein
MGLSLSRRTTGPKGPVFLLFCTADFHFPGVENGRFMRFRATLSPIFHKFRESVSMPA